MAEERVQRRLSAILDPCGRRGVGYSRLIRADEEGTLAALKAHRKELIDPKTAEHGGRIVKLMGDGALVEFASVVDAVECALAIQRGMGERNAGMPEDRRIVLRIGINLGDIVVDGDDIYGDGVNVAARLEGLADPGGVAISGAVYEQVRNRIGLPFEDMGEQDVKNIDRPVRVWRWVVDDSVGATEIAAKAQPLPLPDKPSIAVLPFNNLSNDPEQEYFADSITEDIITELSRLRGFFVIARNSTFVYKGRAVSISEVAHELGVRYVLEGSVRRAGGRVRVTAQLIEGETGSHLWAERYDRDLEDIFAVQDEITQRIVGALEPSVIDAEAERSSRQRPKILDAWSYVARALPLIWTWSDKDYTQAEPLLLKAIEISPNYARAHSILAVGLICNAWFGRAGPHEGFVDRALAEAKTAVGLDEQDPWGHMVLGFVHGYTRNCDDAIAEMQRALDLNPNWSCPGFVDGYGIAQRGGLWCFLS